MFLFIVSIVLALVGIGALLAIPAVKASNQRRSNYDQIPLSVPTITGIVALALSIGAFFWSATYKQDEGESNVLRSFTGKIVDVDDTPGLSLKAPWVKAIPFDVRNNLLEYEGINFTDRNGTGGTLNLKVTYSLNPAGVGEIYKEYKKQEKFESELVANDVSAVVRQVPSKYSNVELLSKRAEVSNEILKALEERWSDEWGVTGIQVALGDITYPDAIRERLENLTAEQTRAEEAKAATITAKETAAQKVAQAKGEAEANALLEKSLTPSVLENRRIEMLKSVGEKGNLIITDGDAQPLLNVDAKKSAEQK